jgi:hypothetical protein
MGGILTGALFLAWDYYRLQALEESDEIFQTATTASTDALTIEIRKLNSNLNTIVGVNAET